MGVKVTISFQGLDEAIERVGNISKKGQANLARLTKELGDDSEKAMKQFTPSRKNRLREGDKVVPGELSFTLNNTVYYYDWVDKGHDTPKGWHRSWGYQKAKRQSHVAGREMTSKTVQFIELNITQYLSKFLDGV